MANKRNLVTNLEKSPRSTVKIITRKRWGNAQYNICTFKFFLVFKLVLILYFKLVLQVILVMKSIGQYEITPTSVMVQIVSHVLAYMNSCVNPILYAFLSENFRKAFRKVIYCGPEGGSHPPHLNGRQIDAEKSALTKNTRTTDILWTRWATV